MPDYKNMDFQTVVETTYGFYGKELYNYSKNYIKQYLFKNENPYVKRLSKGDVSSGEIKPGCIYHFVYNNGGISMNKLCFCVEIASELTKNRKLLIWCLNINAMPLNSRINFFQHFFNKSIQLNREASTVEEEEPFNFKANSLYKYLKSQDFNYIIEPLNLNDIKVARRISTNILEYFLFYINSEENYNILEGVYTNLNEQNNAKDLKEQLKELLDQYRELLDQYQDDSKYFHKKLKQFENNLKLFD